jgi:D-alanyl-lipoteichoic acid acyltransferase DltB (MBOAT superfamily)
MLSMLLGGLWHGASWHFVFWGFWQGLGLAVHKLVSGKEGTSTKTSFNPLAWAVTLLFIMIGWVFFRAQNFETALVMLGRLFLWENLAISWIFSPMYLIVPIIAIAHIIGYQRYQKRYPKVQLLSYSGATIFMFVLLGTVLFYFYNPQPFIYFQF